MIRRKHRDTRTPYAPLPDGDTILAPGQTRTIPQLIAGQRTVRMWSWRPTR